MTVTAEREPLTPLAPVLIPSVPGPLFECAVPFVDLYVLFDIQHAGNPHQPNSRGASGDIDGDGQHDLWEREAELTPFYAGAAQVELAHEGIFSAMLPWGLQSYEARADAARRLVTYISPAQVLVCLCHLNAADGTHDYSAVFWSDRDQQGAAEALGHELGQLPQVAKGVARQARPEPHWTHRAHHQLAFYATQGVPAVLLEPWFVDNPTHAPLASPEGAQSVGRAIARGIKAWWDG